VEFVALLRVCISPLGDLLSLLRDKDFLQTKVRKALYHKECATHPPACGCTVRRDNIPDGLPSR
jgi:hypothetical protein